MPKFSPRMTIPAAAARGDSAHPVGIAAAVDAPADGRQGRVSAPHAGVAGVLHRAGSSSRPGNPSATGSAFSSTAATAPSSRPSTPVPQTGMPQFHAINELASTRFLIERLQWPALALLVVVLHREVPSAWAFTGSVAMNIHAANARGRKIRDFRDADVQVDDTAIASFERRQLYRGDESLLTLTP